MSKIRKVSITAIMATWILAGAGLIRYRPPVGAEIWIVGLLILGSLLTVRHVDAFEMGRRAGLAIARARGQNQH